MQLQLQEEAEAPMGNVAPSAVKQVMEKFWKKLMVQAVPPSEMGADKGEAWHGAGQMVLVV